ncbi:hypothetical protein OH768_27175 [Streptomyces sp. NBC_01622]|uniref:DUF7144 family membrane protein n=1 Tax=Streptomyces sp. NBC_01622 TaxID=2975903 RepID=UPI00386481C2|nr:hypothetical protein OH768_27175 [Streptomyces sp. NBC_01622]
MTQQPHSTQQPHPTSTGGEEKPPVWNDAGQAPGARGYGPPPSGGGLAVGGAVFAGVLMLMNGVIAILQGISALAKDDVYTRVGDYVYSINLTGWGVILLCLGALGAVTGWGILKGMGWARVCGIVLASLSAILQFMFLPYAPIWSVIMIAVDVFVIWALAVYDPKTSGARQ